MSRRDTIIISVLVNAALLAVLFTTAITKTNPLEESKIVKKTLLDESMAKDVVATNTQSKEESSFNKEEKTDIQNKFIALLEEKDEVKKEIVENKNIIVKEEEKIVYKLPEVAKNTQDKTDEKILDDDAFEITVKSGDTLEKIARNNRVKISDISNLNNLPNSFLRIGQKLLIPKNENVQKTNTSPTLKQEDKKPIQNHEFYIVKVGDNPYTIAIKHSIKPHDLLKLNNLDEKKARRLKPGDKLRIR